MKRSEILKLIANRIDDINRYGCSSLEVAKELLEELEAAGMLPPKAKLSHMHEPDCLTQLRSSYCTCEEGIFDNCWEEE